MEESLPIYKRTHPLVPIAAAAVIVMSLIGIGVFTGIIPTHMNSQAQPAPAYSAAGSASAPEAVAGAAANAPPLPDSRPYAPPPYPSQAPAASPAPAAPPAAAVDCQACGRVEAVRAVEVQGKATGVGAVAGGVGGALIGNTIAQRNDRAPLTILGAVGGAFAGHAIEKHARKHVAYQVQVRMDDGSLRTFSAANAGTYAAGERVRVENGGLVRVG